MHIVTPEKSINAYLKIRLVGQRVEKTYLPHVCCSIPSMSAPSLASGDVEPTETSNNLVASSDTPASAAAASSPRRARVAVLFGYVGTRFQGLQKNPGAYTVEDALEAGLVSAGAMTACNGPGALASVGWNRAARTDKGVHAGVQAVSLVATMPTLPSGSLKPPSAGAPASHAECTELRTRLSAALPLDMAAVAVVPVIMRFNAKNLCSSRQYEYLLPTFTLARVHNPLYIARSEKGASEQVPDGAVALAAAVAGAAAQAAGLARLLGVRAAPAKTLWHQYSGDEGIARATTAAQQLPPPISPNVPPDDWQTGAAFARGRAAMWAAAATASAAAAAGRAGPDSGFRLPAADWTRLSELAGLYVGTHAFHNFTPRMTFGDASTVRYIMDCRVSAPFVVGGGGDGAAGIEYVRFTITGQSFLYNQIRHMIGLLVDIVRGAAPPYMLDRAFSVAVVKLPLAPAEGLYLSHCNFAAYETAHNLAALPPGSHLTLTRLPPDARERARAFVEGVIWEHVHRAVVADRPFHAYMQSLEEAPMLYRLHVPVHLIDVLTARGPGHSGKSSWGSARRQPSQESPLSPSPAVPAATAPAGPAVDAAAPTSGAKRARGGGEDAAAGDAGDDGAADGEAPGGAGDDGSSDDVIGDDNGEHDGDDVDGGNDDDDGQGVDGRRDDGDDDATAAATTVPETKRPRLSPDTTVAAAAAAAARAMLPPAPPRTLKQRLKEDDGRAFAYVLDHIDELLLKPARPGMFGGGSISKIAREKTAFKLAQRGAMRGGGSSGGGWRANDSSKGWVPRGNSGGSGGGGGWRNHGGGGGASGSGGNGGSGGGGGGRGGWRSQKRG